MNRIRRIRRIRRSVTVVAGLALAGLASAWLGLAAAAPAAFAASTAIPIGQGNGTAAAPAVRALPQVMVVGGMPGWQIALIAIGSALFAAAAALLTYRILAARRQAVTPA
jgi:hypothetical protein